MFYPLWATLKRLYFPGHFGPEYYEDGTGNQTCHKQSIYYSNLNEKQARHDLLKLDGMSVYIFWTMGNVTWNLDIIKVETTTEITVSTLKKTINSIWILGLLTWPFGAARLVTWHYVLFADRRTLLQNECLRKNFPPWEINWKGYYQNHWTVTILSNWFPTVESSSVSIHFEAKFFQRKEHNVTWLIWPLQMVTWASPKFKCNQSIFSGC